jgi:hypothetical protein
MAFQAPDPLGGAPTGPNPDDLLAQIRDLLDQYLAMGAGTPVAHEAQALADAIDSTTGPGGPTGGPPGAPQDLGAPTDQLGPPDAGTQPHVPGNKQPGGLGDMAEPPPSKSKTYAGANVSALDRLKKRNKKDQGQ